MRRAADVAQLNATAPDQLTAPGRARGPARRQHAVRAGGRPPGRIVARSSALGGASCRRTRDERAARPPARLRDGALGTEPLRIYTAPLGELGRGEAAGGAVIVAGSLAEIERTLDHTRRLVAVCALAAALLAAGLATLLTRRALRPLTRLSSGARAIARSGDPAERLPATPTRDEVGELADTLNAMLASLERAQEAEHRFVGDASHELRTPLTALRGNAAYIAAPRRRPRGARRHRGRRRAALRAARRPAGAGPRGRRRARARASRSRSPSCAQGADEVIDRARRDRRRSSAPRFERAVENLVRNARKHGQGKRHHHRRRRRRRGVHPRRRRGPRAPAPRGDARSSSASPAGSAARGEGSGLGLAIVKAIAERHGGRVEVDGASFTLVSRRPSCPADRLSRGRPGPRRSCRRSS